MNDFITAGSLEVSGTLTGAISADGIDHLSRLLGLTEPPRHDIRVDCPPDADRRCPVCQETVTALVVEAVSLMFTPGRRITGGSERSFSFAGLDPAAYRAEPCGHRVGRDGKEIQRV